MKKTVCAVLCAFVLVCALPHGAAAVCLDQQDPAELDEAVFSQQEPILTDGDLTISAPSAILMEKKTGRVIYEKNADEQREPASVTKIMTILLIVEAIESGQISLDDTVITSARAASMGGSQVFLKEGEQMSVHEMLKSIVVASANDAAVAMAEHLAGSEAAFVDRMNARASELGMTGTRFTNCSGLMDDREHVTTARDIAVMSRELICHEMIKDYSTIWMDTIRNGEFGLSNTNKLIYYYDGATGLKTGFTDRAMFCLSATAEREGEEFIAVILHGETSQQRFEDAKALLSYGFANYATVTNEPEEVLPPVPVTLGKAQTVQPVLRETESILVKKADLAAVTKTVTLEQELSAPVEAGRVIGSVTVSVGEETLGTYDLVAADTVARQSWWDVWLRILKTIFAGG